MSETFYISIGNSDNRLTQAEWAAFCGDIRDEMEPLSHIHGEWFSLPDSAYQNACWCAEFSGPGDEATADILAEARSALSRLARRYRQDSIAFARVATTAFLR